MITIVNCTIIDRCSVALLDIIIYFICKEIHTCDGNF